MHLVEKTYKNKLETIYNFLFPQHVLLIQQHVIGNFLCRQSSLVAFFARPLLRHPPQSVQRILVLVLQQRGQLIVRGRVHARSTTHDPTVVAIGKANDAVLLAERIRFENEVGQFDGPQR